MKLDKEKKPSSEMMHTNPDLILDVPASDLNYEMCQIAVFTKPVLIESIPYFFLKKENYHLVRLALGVDGLSIKFLDESILDKEMCLLASKNLKKDEEDCFLSYIPYRFIDKQICIRAVKNNKSNINYVPLKFMSDEIGNLLMTTNQNNLLAKIPLLIRKNLSQRLIDA